MSEPLVIGSVAYTPNVVTIWEGMREYFADVEKVWSHLTLEADDYRTVPGSVVVMGRVSGHDGEAAIRRRVLWTWRLRDNRAVMLRVSDLGEA